MWIAGRYGWFSIVEDTKDPHLLHVRARSRADLEKLLNWCDVDEREIIDTPMDGYCCHVKFSREGLASVMVDLINDIDYANFEGLIEQTPDQIDKLLYYREVRRLMRDYQQSEERISSDHE